MKVFISGGCKNGKSYYAQRLAKAAGEAGGAPLYYIAAMRPVDAEDDERIVRHRKERDGWGFITVEQYEHVEYILEKCDPRGSFLLDSLTALLANEMFPTDGGVNDLAHESIIGGLKRVMDEVGDIVIVSDYIYSDAVIYDTLTEKYRKSLAALDRAAAEHSDVVVEIAYASVIVHKGKALLGGLIMMS